MAITKPAKGNYMNCDAVSNTIRYICNCVNTDYIGGYGVSLYDIDCSIREFMYIKNIHHKTEGRQVRHFIVSFSPKEERKITPEIASYIGYEIAKYYSNKYQIMFSVQVNTDNLHIHFVMNTVSYVNGKMYAEGFEDYNNLKLHVAKVVEDFLDAL